MVPLPSKWHIQFGEPIETADYDESAADDPMVPASQFSDAPVRDNPNVSVRIERYGGHCGFVGENGGTGLYWAETAVLDFLGSAMK
jgi:predicted alpha/beta-fold hydrolase